MSEGTSLTISYYREHDHSLLLHLGENTLGVIKI